MSDPRGRAWERSAEGDPEARAAWLGGRLRAGELEPRRLAAELRAEALAEEAREVLSELGAGHAELGCDDPLSDALVRLRAWCLEA